MELFEYNPSISAEQGGEKP